MGFIGKQPSKAAITSSDITDGVVTADKLASNAVTTAKINADAVTDAKIADDVVGSEHLTAGEVDTTALGADAVTAAKIADDAISEEHLDVTAITGHTAETSAADADTILIHDDSASALKKMTRSNFLSGVGTAGLTSSSGHITITDGDLIFCGAGHGVYLGVTSATASNLLSDYEEGSWTVDFRRSGSSIGNFSSRSAYYTKIGNVVYVNGGTQYTGSSLTGAYITGDGLPFTISSQNRTGVAGSYHVGPGSGSTNQQAGNAGGWNEQDDFFMVPGGVGQDRYLDEWQQNYYLNFAFWYYTDA
jgi:hypothetical protein